LFESVAYAAPIHLLENDVPSFLASLPDPFACLLDFQTSNPFTHLLYQSIKPKHISIRLNFQIKLSVLPAVSWFAGLMICLIFVPGTPLLNVNMM
jgi:hypothetical protein